jgi:hypothetical protein
VKKIPFFLFVLAIFLGLRPAEGATATEIYNFDGRTSLLRNGKVMAPDYDLPCEAGDVLRIEKDSMMDISMNFLVGIRFFGPAECELKDIEVSTSHLKMNSGTAMINMKALPSDGLLEIETPATVISSKFAKFSVKISKRADNVSVTAVTVKLGTISVYVKESSTAITVPENQHLEVAEDSFIPNARGATDEELKPLDKVLTIYIVEPQVD